MYREMGWASEYNALASFLDTILVSLESLEMSGRYETLLKEKGYMITNKNIRVRFAPSPTGNLHIGGLRTALFNWLFARHYGGAFLLRIEDTDLERSRPEYTDAILEAFKWAGIESDEPLVFQTQRMEIYKKYLQRLLDSGHAYRSDPAQEENGKSVIRFRVPREQKTISFDDLIYGKITFSLDHPTTDGTNTSGMDDFVIARADDTPLYNFVVVVDDIEMKISHIIRADEHIPNTPRQLLLYNAFGVTPPQFAHVSLIFGPNGKPLSKRDASTSVLEYRDEGFLPEALCNYLVRLGWSHGDQEIFSREDLIKCFTLDGINKSGAMFDVEKLLWVSGVYIRNTNAQKLLHTIVADVDKKFHENCYGFSQRQLLAAIDLYKERVTTLKQLSEMIAALSVAPQLTQLPEGFAWNAQTLALLEDLTVRLSDLVDVSAATIKTMFADICKQENVALPLLAKPVRYALTGLMDSPSVYALVELLGKDETIRRCDALKDVIRTSLE